MIWRLLVYGVALAMILTAPPWWSGFAGGVGGTVLMFDLWTLLATRQHRKDTESRVERG